VATKQTTLLYIIKDDKILLAEKKRGFGVGKINGIGGKLEKGETVEQAMIRETQEEIGVTPLNCQHLATITFRFGGFESKETEVTTVFVASEYEGEIMETEEMRPFWYEIDKIPYEKMFSADKIWFPKILKGKHFTCEVVFDKDFNTLDTKMNYIN